MSPEYQAHIKQHKGERLEDKCVLGAGPSRSKTEEEEEEGEETADTAAMVVQQEAAAVALAEQPRVQAER